MKINSFEEAEDWIFKHRYEDSYWIVRHLRDGYFEWHPCDKSGDKITGVRGHWSPTLDDLNLRAYQLIESPMGIVCRKIRELEDRFNKRHEPIPEATW